MRRNKELQYRLLFIVRIRKPRRKENEAKVSDKRKKAATLKHFVPRSLSLSQTHTHSHANSLSLIIFVSVCPISRFVSLSLSLFSHFLTIPRSCSWCTITDGAFGTTKKIFLSHTLTHSHALARRNARTLDQFKNHNWMFNSSGCSLQSETKTKTKTKTEH